MFILKNAYFFVKVSETTYDAIWFRLTGDFVTEFWLNHRGPWSSLLTKALE